MAKFLSAAGGAEMTLTNGRTAQDSRDDTLKLLWVDLRRPRLPNQAANSLAALYRVHKVCDVAAIANALEKFAADLLCFDFDSPEPDSLCAMRRARRRHPHVPTVMLTQYHCKELALFAFRSRVDDYLVKPVATRQLVSRLQAVFDRDRHRSASLAAEAVDCEPGFVAPTRTSGKTLRAVSYITANFDTRIDLKTVAGQCRLSPSQFCRVFKKEQGIAFSEYLLRHRISTAGELLACSPFPVKEVAYAVGFNDLSYFSRMFRRCLGTSPSEYANGKREERYVLHNTIEALPFGRASAAPVF